jgi:hypothetical protein
MKNGGSVLTTRAAVRLPDYSSGERKILSVQSQQDFRHEQRLLLQQGVGQHTRTGTCSQTTRGTQRVAVYATCFGTHRWTWIVFV